MTLGVTKNRLTYDHIIHYKQRPYLRLRVARPELVDGHAAEGDADGGGGGGGNQEGGQYGWGWMLDTASSSSTFGDKNQREGERGREHKSIRA